MVTQGWVKIDSILGGVHHYDRGYPACKWNAHGQLDEQGRCIVCAIAVQQTTGDLENLIENDFDSQLDAAVK